MSNRHRSSKEAVPGAIAPSKQERKAANRKARHRTHEMLAHADAELGEDIVDPVPVHTRMEREPGEVVAAGNGRRRDYRHWKQKFWKRRNNVRQERAKLEDQELPVPDIG